MRIIALLALLRVLYVGDASAQFTGPVPDNDIEQMAPGVVTVVNFEGNKEISDLELQTVTVTHVTGWFSRQLNSIPVLKAFGAPYMDLDYATLQRDTAALKQYYRDNGFLQAKATFRVSGNKEDKKAYTEYLRRRLAYKGPPGGADKDVPKIQDTVTFYIDEGPAYTIDRIAIEGLQDLPDEFQPELTEKVTVKHGQRWSREVAATEVSRLDSIMVENGYPFFHHDTIVVENNEGSSKVNVLLYFSPGHRYRYGPIRIQYDTAAHEKKQVSDKVILAQLYIDSGRWFKASEIQHSEAALYRLNTFELVRISMDTTTLNSTPDSLEDGMAVPINVFVRLRTRQEVSPGVFVGTSNTQGIVAGVTAGYSNRNLTGGADNLTTQASWQFFPQTQKRLSASADYVIPYIGWKRVPLTIGAGYSRTSQDSISSTDSAKIIHNYFNSTYSLRVGSNFNLGEFDNRSWLRPEIAFEYVRTEASDSATRANLGEEQLGIIPSATYQSDRSNDIFNPTKGFVLGLQTETGLPFTLGPIASSAYLKGWGQYKLYHDLSSKGASVIAARVGLGATLLYYPDPDSIRRVPPPERRFYGGGSANIRGWPERSLLVSNRDGVLPDFGGYNELLISAEWRYAPFQYDKELSSWQKLSAPIRIVLFYDGGNVWDNSVSWSDVMSHIAHTVGLGLRYNTMFGALRFDWGLRLYDPSGRFEHENPLPVKPSDTGAWAFSRFRPFVKDGKKLGPDFWTFQFGIGQAF